LFGQLTAYQPTVVPYAKITVGAENRNRRCALKDEDHATMEETTEDEFMPLSGYAD
jgi:hypothetical protein